MHLFLFYRWWSLWIALIHIKITWKKLHLYHPQIMVWMLIRLVKQTLNFVYFFYNQWIFNAFTKIWLEYQCRTSFWVWRNKLRFLTLMDQIKISYYFEGLNWYFLYLRDQIDVGNQIETFLVWRTGLAFWFTLEDQNEINIPQYR